MWRTRAVVSMLVEDIAGLEMVDSDEENIQRLERETLDRAMRRAKLVVAVDFAAILILFLFRDTARPFLPLNQTIETVFTFGVLAVAAHAGFRWAQLERLRTVRRLCEELRQREED